MTNSAKRTPLLVTAVLVVALAVAYAAVSLGRADRPTEHRNGSSPTSAATSHSAATDTAAADPAAKTLEKPLSKGAFPYAKKQATSKKKVFAHYMTSFPLSIDNKPSARDYYTVNYLNPHGENDKFRYCNGILRDRPIPTPPSKRVDWMLENYKKEIRIAQASGLDGFTIDLLSVEADNYNWERTKLMFKAAAELNTGFVVVIMPDSVALDPQRTSTDRIAQAIAELSRYSSAYRIQDGRLVVAPFYAENREPQWWSQILTTLRDKHHVQTAFVPNFLDYFASVEKFDAMSYGFSYWTTRVSPNSNEVAKHAADAHRRGKIWMSPVPVQDVRPNQSNYVEAENTRNLREIWGNAIDSNAEWVQLLTWNDYSEGTHFAPSVAHGYAFLDISGYFIQWFKYGKKPAITSDAIILTHRNQFTDSKPKLPSSKPMQLRAGNPTHNNVEVLAFLTAPAKITLRAGSTVTTKTLPAGLQTFTAPLQVGTVSANLARDSHAVAITSGTTVQQRPRVQDLQYFATSSIRGNLTY